MNALTRNNVTISGVGEPTFLFSHGFGCDQNMWRFVAPALSSAASCVLFDHVGAGESDTATYSSAKYGSLEGYAQDVIEICDELRLRDVVFVGHSVSATIGVLAAVRRPDLFGALVLLCPSPRYANAEAYQGGFEEADLDELLDLMAQNQIDFSAVLSPVVMGAEQAPELEAEWRQNVCRTDPAISTEFARVTFKSDHRAAYGLVTTPTLLIECSDDALAPPAVGQWVHGSIGGSTRRILQASGHSPHLTRPAEVIAAIQGYMADHIRRRAA